MTQHADLLARIDAWLAEPADQDATAALLMDVAEALEVAETLESKTAFSSSYTPPTIRGPTARRVYDAIQSHPEGISVAELSRQVDRPHAQIQRMVILFSRQGHIRHDRGQRGHYGSSRAYPLPQQVAL